MVIRSHNKVIFMATRTFGNLIIVFPEKVIEVITIPRKCDTASLWNKRQLIRAPAIHSINVVSIEHIGKIVFIVHKQMAAKKYDRDTIANKSEYNPE